MFPFEPSSQDPGPLSFLGTRTATKPPQLVTRGKSHAVAFGTYAVYTAYHTYAHICSVLYRPKEESPGPVITLPVESLAKLVDLSNKRRKSCEPLKCLLSQLVPIGLAVIGAANITLIVAILKMVHPSRAYAERP